MIGSSIVHKDFPKIDEEKRGVRVISGLINSMSSQAISPGPNFRDYPIRTLGGGTGGVRERLWTDSTVGRRRQNSAG